MQGGDVDWFVAIKLPREADGGWGTSFVYFDPTQEGWIMSPVPVDSYMSAIGATISQIYVADKSRTFTIAYSDGSPSGEAEWGRGHSKGVAAFDTSVGFWMYQLSPTNLIILDWYGYPSTGRRYDIWYDFIAPYFNTPMAVETWRNGYARDLGTTCGLKPNVYDVNYVNLLGRTFANHQDHSKWGVSMNAAVPAVCIGDINRQESQYRRGGGAVCILDQKLWRTFYYSVIEYEECPPFGGGYRT
ncbi:deoxyribonuclease II [Ancylostoma ceylanicum]|uniref:Deoxyribonuclease II n=1 Tax=Ancylostoma ceylanicum TaxID=53326 RepID=A0A0D6M2E2_9BILA|nr:deoxyribonuclease II [Ancylostoma ceylanicum]